MDWENQSKNKKKNYSDVLVKKQEENNKQMINNKF